MPPSPSYVLRLALFDTESALTSRSSRPVDESGLSLDTRTGLPLELDREAQAQLKHWSLPVDLFSDLSAPAQLRAELALRRRLNPCATVFDPTAERDGFASSITPLYEPLRPLDYRFGRITVDYDDMAPAKEGGVAGEQARAAKANGTIDVGFGLVHLYRDNLEMGAMPSEAGPSKAPAEEPCTILGVLAIPPVMSISDFLVFVQPAADSISQIRMIRDTMPNRCMALIKFRAAEDAIEFQDEYDGKPFWAMLDDEICHIVRISSVEVTASTSPPFTTPFDDAPAETGPPGTIELPTCPVCLERMDASVTGLCTILCQHTFHCNCLSKWAGGKCPVCRYSASRSAKSAAEEKATANACDVCGAGSRGESLWMCLLCGHVGCGRYQGGHAAAHYEGTMHLYAIELDSQRVWDYAGDAYVHRLIQNKTDGKLVELPSRHGNADDDDGGLPGVPSGGPNRAARQAQEKAEAIGVEYSHLLSSQLASQRAYYSDIVVSLKEEISKHEARERKAEKAIDLARGLQRELASEREMTKGLLANMKAMREENATNAAQTATLRGEVAELQDQLRDLMFALSARDKIESAGANELAGGSIAVPPPPAASTPSPRRNKKR